MDRTLDSQFRGTDSPERVMFQETWTQDSADIRLSSRPVIEAVSRLHQDRKANHEARFVGSQDPAAVNFENWSFKHNSTDNFFWASLPDGTKIGVSPYIFKEDAAEVLRVLHANRQALSQAGPLTIRIGVLMRESTALGSCLFKTGDISFYSDGHDGLYATGLATVTKSDKYPVSLARAVMHEVAHVMERNPEVDGALALLRSELMAITMEAIRSPKKKAIELISPGLLGAAKAINPEYLPNRLLNSIEQARSKFQETSSEDAALTHAHLMGSEFWAEAFAARVWEKSAPDLPANSSPGVYMLCKYIEAYGAKLRPGPILKKNDELKEVKRSFLPNIDERIEDFGNRGGPPIDI